MGAPKAGETRPARARSVTRSRAAAAERGGGGRWVPAWGRGAGGALRGVGGALRGSGGESVWGWGGPGRVCVGLEKYRRSEGECVCVCVWGGVAWGGMGLG